MHVLVIFCKNKRKVLTELILKGIVPSGLNAKIEEIQEEHQQAIQQGNNQIEGIKFENVRLQDEMQAKDQEIAVLERCYVNYLANEDKKKGINIIAKNEQAEYSYISM